VVIVQGSAFRVRIVWDTFHDGFAPKLCNQLIDGLLDTGQCTLAIYGFLRPDQFSGATPFLLSYTPELVIRI
jgi:hypothetical protein